jgi:hypothetical protein
VSLNAHGAPTVEDATGFGGEAAHGMQHGPDEGCLQCDAYRNGLTHGIYERGYSEGFRAGEESVKTGGQYSEGFDRGFAEADKEWKARMGKIWEALAPFFDEDAMGQIHVTGKVVMVDGEEFDLREVFGG